MPKPKTTFKTSSPATPNTKPRRLSGARGGWLGSGALAAAVLLLTGATPVPSASNMALDAVLAAHLRALQVLRVTVPRTLQTRGTLVGLGLTGKFETWREGENERYDETLGVRRLRTLRVGGVEYVQNANGDVRVLRGISKRRQITEDFIDSGDFARHPEDAVLVGRAKLYDGRDVWQLRVTPPGGEAYGVALDAQTGMVDEKAYPDGDGLARVDYRDYRVVNGALVPFVEVDSSGDRAFDIVSHVQEVRVNAAIAARTFAPPRNVTIVLAAPATVALRADGGHLFARANVNGIPMTFLVDSGSQGLFLSPAAAQRAGLHPQGELEIHGARRTKGLGVAALDSIDIGPARLPVRVVSIVDLSSVTYRGETVDGVLGYPFFAAAEVRIDPDRLTMTMARPGGLAALGSALAIDTDRELPEVTARIDRSVEGRFLVDTGNTNELLVFHAFIDAHPGLISVAGKHFAANRGVGGSSAAVMAVINELDLGGFKLYNRFTDVMLSATGAFADRNDAGNIGLGVLRNFVFTFDLANHALYLEPGSSFDDGRFRPLGAPQGP